MSGNKVTFGLEKVHIAFLDDSGASPSWETPIAIPGAVGFTPSPEGDETKFYADNGLYFAAITNDGYTADLEVALFPDEVIAEMLGWVIDDNGMLVEVADGRPKPFALLAQIQGDKRPRRFVYYKCQAGRPSKEYTTKGETVDVATDTLNMTIMPVEVDGRRIVKGTIEKNEENATEFDGFFSDVLTPSIV